MLKLYNDQLRPWRVVLVQQGDSYGLNNCLTHDEPEPMVEFWCAKHDQFVSRYCVSTIMECDAGINLHGGVKAWTVDWCVVLQVQRWLQAEGVV